MRGADDGGGRAARNEHGDVRRVVDLHAVLKVLDQRLRLVVKAEMMGAQRQQRAGVGVQFFAIGPEIIKRLRLKRADRALFLGRMIDGQRVQHPGLLIEVQFLFDERFVEIS